VFVLDCLSVPGIHEWALLTTLLEQTVLLPDTLSKEADPVDDSEPTFFQIVVSQEMLIWHNLRE
jgi:hypothetical protein